MWRWSYVYFMDLQGHMVFSTYVEVILETLASRHSPWCILHVCGGDPLEKTWFTKVSNVFSKYVEVILNQSQAVDENASILQVCGGDPQIYAGVKGRIRYSPRMWRWSYSWIFRYEPTGVFSKYVEVILRVNVSNNVFKSILHVCGGDPETKSEFLSHFLYSPRMWRWS